MYNPDDIYLEIKDYLKKLQKHINTKARVTLFTTKLYDKNRIDDIFCCIEGVLPKEYKDFVRTKSGKRLKSWMVYTQLNALVRHKFMFSTSLYAVDYKCIDNLITSMLNSIISDLNYIYNLQRDKI